VKVDAEREAGVVDVVKDRSLRVPLCKQPASCSEVLLL
jgi:hypothetical protein